MAELKHVTVFEQPDTFAGWPANHGAWQWGDEFLVGFLIGQHHIGGLHNVRDPLTKMQARSLDGGETWQIEKPNVDFEAREIDYNPPEFDLQSSIIRVCGGYDHGGEECHILGGFYLSRNRGKVWHGAYAFNGIKFDRAAMNTSRTCVLDDLLFLSVRDRALWGSDASFCVRHVGREFKVVGSIRDDESRAVMPAAARIGDRLVVALRRRGSRRPGGWIDACVSDDEGQTWSSPVHVADTGSNNGNPPALIEHGGNLYCAYGDRSQQAIFVSRSSDRGESWWYHADLRWSNAPDIGYPRLFKRSDGKLVCVYYWTEEYEKPQRIEATIFKC